MGMAVFMALMVMLVGFGLECHYLNTLRPYRNLIWHLYWPWISGYLGALFFNLMCLFWRLEDPARRRNRPGRKVAKMDSDFREGRMDVGFEDEDARA